MDVVVEILQLLSLITIVAILVFPRASGRHLAIIKLSANITAGRLEDKLREKQKKGKK